MTILIGGNFASGGVHGWDYQSAATGMGDRLKLESATGGRGVLFAATTSQRDFAVSGSYRAELSQPININQWGRTFHAAWNVVFPPDWEQLPEIVNSVVLQMHDVNVAAVNRPPSFAGEVTGNQLRLLCSHDGSPLGEVLGSITVAPGQEVSVWLRVRWADGTNESLANGFIETYINGSMVGRSTGRNHWATVDPNPPYIKVGIYVPSTNSAWAGKSKTMWSRGAVLADAGEPFSQLQALMETQTVFAASQASNQWTV